MEGEKKVSLASHPPAPFSVGALPVSVEMGAQVEAVS